VTAELTFEKFRPERAVGPTAAPEMHFQAPQTPARIRETRRVSARKRLGPGARVRAQFKGLVSGAALLGARAKDLSPQLWHIFGRHDER